MLQQTQAARVVPYYEAWLARFPDAATLAAAPAADVLRAWSGLGYNRRALALQRAAAVVAREGWPPGTAGEAGGRTAGLRALPGVGPYTAAAVASFAWDEPVAAVDTNVRRVIERWDGERRNPGALAARADALVPPDAAAAWNQAMMELGATVCRPRAPRCDACPVRAGCATRGERPAAPRRRRAAVRFEDTDRWARGRLLAALLDGAPPPALDPAREARVIAGLERDGLVVRESGEVRLP